MQNSISRKKFDQHKLWIYEWLNCNSDSNECQVIVATRYCYDKFFKCSAAWSEVKWSEVTQSGLTLFDPMDCSLPGSSVCGLLQSRILEWVAISFSRESSQPRDRTRVSRIPGRRFNHWATREAPKYLHLLVLFPGVCVCMHIVCMCMCIKYII